MIAFSNTQNTKFFHVPDTTNAVFAMNNESLSAPPSTQVQIPLHVKD